MRITVLQQTVSHVADLQQVLVVFLLHSSVNSPAHHLHSSLCPILNIVPDWKEREQTQLCNSHAAKIFLNTKYEVNHLWVTDESKPPSCWSPLVCNNRVYGKINYLSTLNYREMKSFCTRMAEIPQSFHSTRWWAQSNKTSRTPVHNWLHVDRERGVPSPKRLSLQGRWVRAVITWGSVWRICGPEEDKGQHGAGFSS